MKPKIAIVRGKFLNRYEMQFLEPLVSRFALTAFGSLTPYHDQFAFPVVKLPSPMDLPDFPYKMPILNRLFIDAHYLVGLEEKLRGFDLVHTAETYFHYTQQALNAKRRGYVKKVISTVLENIPFNNEGIWGRKAFKKRAREELDHIIALTNKTKQALIMEGSEPSKITVIGHFVDTKRFKPVFPGRTGRIRTFHQRPVRILFVGRLEQYKGVFEVIRAARLLLNDPGLKSYHLIFTLVGDGSEKGRLRELEKKWGIAKYVVHKTLPYTAMPQEYQKADIFVAPSKPRLGSMVHSWIDRTRKSRPDPEVTWEEQYNTALLEAQASGLPIVTTRSGGIPENVGDAALLVEPGDTLALADTLKRFILDARLRRDYAKRARTRAVSRHDIKFGASRLAQLYHKVLERA